MRVSLQFRTGNGGDMMRRWQRSVFLDTVNQGRIIPFAELTPAPGTSEAAPALEEISQILFVVDTTNNRPGASGRFWISSVALQR
jgi:hypothetical protein